MPSAGTTQRKPAHHNAVFVDAKATFDVGERLEEVDLTRKFAPIAVPTVGLKQERIRARKLAGGLGHRIDEVDLGQRLVAPVEPGIQPESLRLSVSEGGRQ